MMWQIYRTMNFLAIILCQVCNTFNERETLWRLSCIFWCLSPQLHLIIMRKAGVVANDMA